MTVWNLAGETNERDRLLALLMEWTTERRIIAALVRAGHADFPGIAVLAAMVRATLDGKPGEGDVKAQPMTERQVAAAILAFLGDNATRNVIATYVAQAHGDKLASIPGESRRDVAKRDLYELRVHIQTTYHLNADEVPRLVAGDPKTHAAMLVRAEQERALVNTLMAWQAGDPKPEWVVEYEQDSEVELTDSAAEWLRAMRPEAQDVAKRFPPYSLVRGTRDLVCPAPGLVAIVKGYDVEATDNGNELVVKVAAFLDPSAPTVACRPAWLELAATRGALTCEAVAEALSEISPEAIDENPVVS